MIIKRILGSMYSLKQIQRGISNPKLLLREVNKIYNCCLRRHQYNSDGIDVFTEDWDNLIILDACRYDTYSNCADEHDLPGELHSKVSKGSDTVEWLYANVDSRELTDTVYVTANPQCDRKINSDFYDIINVWKYQEAVDNRFNVVMPETMERFALDALKQYPHKRLLIHFVQPHCPFIGPIGSEWFDNVGLQFWREILTDNIHYTDDKLLAAYVENLEEVIPSVERLIDNLTGRTVVSADHGQVIGEQATPIPIQEYGHPRYSPMDNLVKVPWMFVESEQRREINSETPVEDSVEPENVDVQQHLEALGYI